MRNISLTYRATSDLLKISLLKILAPTVLLLMSQHAWCDEVSTTLQAKLNAIRTMNASFSQVVKAKKHEVSRSSGTMALFRPGRFRWETKKPMEQLVVADGKHLWIYDVDLEQVTVKKQEQGVGGTAGLFLSGYDDTVARDFDVTTYEEGDKQYFDLHAKSSKANFQRVKLIFVGERLKGMELYDQLGQHTDVNLSNIKHNPTLSTALFKFKTPKGVDVVDQ
jgi:outer membrane lipoprotein carrier protein